jgi:hypothetical protein
MDGARALQGIEYEIAAEKAASLGRVAGKMEAAVAALHACEAPGAARDELFAAAAEWVWCYVVQREAMGWRDHREALALYGVPDELYARMGPRPRVSSSAPRT